MVQVMVVTPKGKVSGASFSIEAIVQLSVAVTVPVVKSVAEQLPVSVPMVISDGNITIGSIASLGWNGYIFCFCVN